MTFYVNYITYLLVTLMSSVVRYSGHYNLILRTIQYYIPKLLYSIGIQQAKSSVNFQHILEWPVVASPVVAA